MDLIELEKKYCSQGDTSGKHQPKKLFHNQEGSFLFDVKNIAYLDMQMFNSAANFGYKNPLYNSLLDEKNCNMLCLAGEFIHENRIKLSAKIAEYMHNTYDTKGRVHFTVGGAQAVDDALKLAFNYTQKNKVFAFEGGYHGRTMASSSISASYRYTKQFGSVIDTHRIPFPNCYRCPYNKLKSNCDLYCIEQFERLFENEFNGVTDSIDTNTSIAAFVIEPVLGRGGYVFPHEKYFVELAKILHKHHILLVVDEVQMGFYRTGTQWSFEHYNIIPDIVIFGKAITNGIWPLAGVWAKEEIISPHNWPVGSTHCTFANSPFAMALGLKTLEMTSLTNFINTQKQGAIHFNKIICKLKEDFPFIGRSQVKGHAAGIDIINSNTCKLDGKKANQLMETALNESVIIGETQYRLILTTGGPHNSSLMLSPSLNMSANEYELFNLLIREYFKKVFL